MNNAYIRAQQCKVKEAKFPFVKIGGQYWTKRNLDLSATPQGNNIPEMQANGNVEKVVNGTMEGTYVAGVAPNWSVVRGNPFENTITQYAGVSSQIITNPAGSTGVISQSVNVIINKWYKFAFYAKKTKGTGGLVVDYTGGGLTIPSIQIENNDWALYSICFKAINNVFGIGFYAQNNTVNDTNGISFDNISLQEIGWSGSQELYDGIYAQTIGTVEQKTYAAVKAAAMWCNYNNDVAIGAVYGKLYNWFAVKYFQMDIDYYNAANPTKKWANGFRMPTQVEFQTLSTYLGGDAVSGGHLKEAGLDHWASPNTGADNSSGFTALGGGRINEDGVFADNLRYEMFWSITENITFAGRIYLVNTSISTAIDNITAKGRGYAIRLIKS